jgi:hypothetical protein
MIGGSPLVRAAFVLTIVVGAPLSMGNAGCDDSDDRARNQQEQILNQANDAVGMPAITRFSAKRNLKRIYELADQQVPTISYFFDLQGHLHKLCDSFGYPIPYSTEYTNPLKPYSQGLALGQADPDALFHAPSSDGTWVMCLKPGTKEVWPVYVEPKVTASPFPLPGVVE